MQILLHAQSIFFVFMSRPGYVLHYDTNFPLCLPEVLRVSVVSVCKIVSGNSHRKQTSPDFNPEKQPFSGVKIQCLRSYDAMKAMKGSDVGFKFPVLGSTRRN